MQNAIQCYELLMFQFHNGTINTNKKRNMDKDNQSFNSTTVQLILFPRLIHHL